MRRLRPHRSHGEPDVRRHRTVPKLRKDARRSASPMHPVRHPPSHRLPGAQRPGMRALPDPREHRHLHQMRAGWPLPVRRDIQGRVRELPPSKGGLLPLLERAHRVNPRRAGRTDLQELQPGPRAVQPVRSRAGCRRPRRRRTPVRLLLPAASIELSGLQPVRPARQTLFERALRRVHRRREASLPVPARLARAQRGRQEDARRPLLRQSRDDPERVQP